MPATIVVFGLLVSAIFAPAVAATPETVTAEEPDTSPLYAGSSITYRNSVTALTLDESAELTHNPTWVMSWEFAPRLRLSEIFSIGARLDISRELTHSDDNTFADETLLSNVSLSASASKWVTIPGAEITVSNTLGVVFPTSKGAQAQTLYVGLSGSLALGRSFDVLSGLHLGYTLRATKFLNEHTTSERETPLVPGCFASSDGCESHLNTGVRNVSWGLANVFDVSLGLLDWVSFGTTVGVLTSFLYDAATDPRVNLTPQETTDTRHALLYDIHFEFVPIAPLTVVVGTNTINPQLAPDSSRYGAFFNRYTTLYLDLRLDVAELVGALTHP